jgi:hypothetical protein
VRVRVAGRLQGKHNSVGELQQEIERAIFEAAPEAMRVEIAGLPDVNVHELRFVPHHTQVPSDVANQAPSEVAGRTEAGAQ